MIRFSESVENKSQILAIGIGGAGGSVIDRINGVDTFLIDTDQDAINNSISKDKICITSRLDSEELVGQLKAIVSSLPKAEIVFTISGLGGNTGTTITPILLQLLKERSYWTWSLVTLPFFFEGKPKILNSLKGLKSIQGYADSFFVVPHDKVFKMVDKNISMKEVFTPAGNLCAELVMDVMRLTSSSWVNIKFSEIKSRMAKKKSTSFGIGEGNGDSRLRLAIEQAFGGPLLGKDVLGHAESVIVSIAGSEDLTLDEVRGGIEYLRAIIAKDIDIVFGVSMDSRLNGSVKVGIIVTGIEAGSNIDDWGIITSVKDVSSVKRAPYLTRPLQPQQKAQQVVIDFKKLYKGRFEKSEATIYGGEDLDVPTFLRRKRV